MKLIVRAADFAMTESITDGCLRAIRDGILNDVGLMTNNYNYAKRACDLLKMYPHVSIGQDLNLCTGKAALSKAEIPSLVDDEGYFIPTKERNKTNSFDIPYIESYKEMKAQIERTIEFTGKKPCYIIGHSLYTPDIEKGMKDLCAEYNIEYNPFLQEDLQMAKRWYYKNTGIKITGDKISNVKPHYDLTAQSLTDVEAHIVNEECEFDYTKEFAMLPTHCGYCDGELLRLSSFSVVRGKELEALVSPKVRAWVEKHNIELINYNQYLEQK